MKRSTLFQVGAGCLIAAAGVGIFIGKVDLPAMARELQKTPWWKIGAVAALNVVCLQFRAWRWTLLLPRRRESSRKGVFPLVMIGFMVNNIFPARAGEAVRAGLLWKRNHFTLAESLGSLLVERFLDMIVFALFLAVPIFMIPRLSELRLYGGVLSAVLAAIILCLFAYASFPVFTKRIAKRGIALLPVKYHQRVGRIAGELGSNLDWLFSATMIPKVVALSLLTLVCQIAMLWVLGLGIAGFGFMVSMFGTACAALGAAIPLSPGYVGTLHAALLSGLDKAGVAAGQAGAVAILYHAVGYATIVGVGMYYFFSLRISFKEIRKSTVSATETDSIEVK